MGISATYYAVTSQEAKNLKNQIHEKTSYAVLEKFEEYHQTLSVDIDKAWDGLHFLLTGYNSDESYNSQKSERDLVLYYAFLGQEYLSEEGIAFTDSTILPKIVSELRQVNLVELLKTADFTTFDEANLYPQIWKNENRENLTEYLTENFELFVSFYQKALEQNRSILIVII